MTEWISWSLPRRVGQAAASMVPIAHFWHQRSNELSDRDTGEAMHPDRPRPVSMADGD
jgi:hypothetical protein